MIYDGLRHQPRCAWATVIKTRKQEWIHWIFSSSKVSAFKKRAFPYACAYGCSFGYKFTPVRTRRLSTTMLPSKLTPYVASLLGRARYSNLTPSSILVIFRRTMIQILLDFFDIFRHTTSHPSNAANHWLADMSHCRWKLNILTFGVHLGILGVHSESRSRGHQHRHFDGGPYC